jgi:hypothetical protein
MAHIGDIFSIPLGDGRIAIGQIFETSSPPGLAVILVFEQLFPDGEPPSLDQLKQCIATKPVFMASSFDSPISRGEWSRLANMPPVLDRSKSPAFRVAGLPLGLILQSYDWKRKRLARPREINAAPNHYSISPKWLEDAVKAYFGVKELKWQARFDKLLFKNVVPFGRRKDYGHAKTDVASHPRGHIVVAKIMDPILPMARGRKYEEPLDEALQARGFGSVTGAGTQTQSDQDNPVAWIGLDLELCNLDEALEFTRRTLRELGAPPGSVLEYRVGEKPIVVQIT